MEFRVANPKPPRLSIRTLTSDPAAPSAKRVCSLASEPSHTFQDPPMEDTKNPA